MRECISFALGAKRAGKDSRPPCPKFRCDQDGFCHHELRGGAGLQLAVLRQGRFHEKEREQIPDHARLDDGRALYRHRQTEASSIRETGTSNARAMPVSSPGKARRVERPEAITALPGQDLQ
jgi:hypothetical protein